MIEKYIIFDGNCGFCNKFLMKIAKKDKKDVFLFVSNISDLGLNLLIKYKIIGLEKSTIILIENHNIYIKSSAIKKILLNLQYYNILGKLMFLFPEKISNYIYDIISINRAKILQNSDCKIPSSKIKRKFII
jgi:predicted DCC family thiol-disulfide oxidoreductase YuxK